MDPYVQMPDFTQSYNRYSYGWNNPLRYADKNGKFLGTILTFIIDLIETAFFDGGLDPTSNHARDNAWKQFDPTANWSKTNHAWKIDKGLWETDPNRNFWQRTWQLFSRFTWEGLQTGVGTLYSHIRNVTGNVDRVDYFGGVTFVTNEHSKNHNGVTLGNYININMKDEIFGDFENWVLNDPMYMHEYGHTLDSQGWGPLYLFAIGIPSAISAWTSDYISKWDGKYITNPHGLYEHDVYWTERRANKRAAKYFKKYYDIDWETLYPDYPLENPFK
ncbi:hypothetical protein FACS1894176_10930 [Bacteroidia bacterium]|nr:hypothetical protein FACS1894176_10930 [Bacteroidia bacterium]